MARYHLSWEIVEDRMPNDPKEIAMGWKALIGFVKADLDTGVLKEWGAFPGQRGGYAVMEGSEMDVLTFTMQYAPHIRFEVRPLVGVGEVETFLNAMTA